MAVRSKGTLGAELDKIPSTTQFSQGKELKTSFFTKVLLARSSPTTFFANICGIRNNLGHFLKIIFNGFTAPLTKCLTHFNLSLF
jgi:hypothetical protein